MKDDDIKKLSKFVTGDPDVFNEGWELDASGLPHGWVDDDEDEWAGHGEAEEGGIERALKGRKNEKDLAVQNMVSKKAELLANIKNINLDNINPIARNDYWSEAIEHLGAENIMALAREFAEIDNKNYDALGPRDKERYLGEANDYIEELRPHLR